MDFTPTSDQLALAEGVREFCARRYDEEALRAQTPADAALWRDLGGLGVFALRQPEPEGAGLGVAEAAITFEELGRALVPGPLVGSHLAAGLVDGAAEGEAIVTLVDATTDPVVVEHSALITDALAFRTDAVAHVGADSLKGEPAGLPVDPLTPVLRLDGAVPDGTAVTTDVTTLLMVGAVLTAAYQLGIAESMTQRSVSYAKEREQFGRPIGTFQAVKHMCADMLVRAELAKAAVYAAAVTLDDPEVGEPSRAAAIAKLLADEAATLNAKTAIQVHGGMGFTWEMPLHLYLKRAWLLATTFGTVDEHALALADAV
jgi:alkylation response protein AidB-like acyl-CoA dehydrogenase